MCSQFSPPPLSFFSLRFLLFLFIYFSVSLSLFLSSFLSLVYLFLSFLHKVVIIFLEKKSLCYHRPKPTFLVAHIFGCIIDQSSSLRRERGSFKIFGKFTLFNFSNEFFTNFSYAIGDTTRPVK